ncbi:MAG: tetratricopeptide repeat protein, partial [Helicobacter sp.]|nr:tetratricopeptide repeat protein [Helicobacter sp.]
MKVLIFYPFYYYAMKIYHKDKDYKKANKFYQIAERFCPNHTENLFKIGMCYKKCRNYKEASKYFQKALELDFENEKYKEQLEIARTRDFALFAPTKLWWQEIIALEQEIQQKGESYAR